MAQKVTSNGDWHRFNFRPHTVVELECDPPEKLTDAVDKLVNHPNIDNATIINGTNKISVLIGSQRFQSYKNSLNYPGMWTLSYVKKGSLGSKPDLR